MCAANLANCGVVLLSVFDSHGRLVFFLMFAPFYVLWSLLFSYEARTLAMDLPFAADCFACGSAVAAFGLRMVRFVGKRLMRLPSSTANAPSIGRSSKAAIALGAVNAGFNAEGVLTMRMSLASPRYVKAAEVERLVRDGVERIRAVPE